MSSLIDMRKMHANIAHNLPKLFMKLHQFFILYVYVAAKVNWLVKVTLTKESVVRVYFNQRLWLK